MVFLFDWKNLEAYFRRRADVSVKKVFLQILQNSQENTCVKVSFLIKLLAWGLQFYLKRDSGAVVFLWILRIF